MSELVVRDLYKSFAGARVYRGRSVRGDGARIEAVRGVEFDLTHGELLAVLGPSGCGKTTALRLIAGFERPDRGTIALAGENIVPLTPEKRRIGFVFQNYALFPHMSVAGNIGYGMRRSRSEGMHRRKRIAELLEMVDLAGYERRRPHQLSAGQCQRVALARALAPQPRLLLLDEPLSALDAKLRETLRTEIRSVQRRVDLPTIYVTHDQDEALTVADRIAVMHAGAIEQIGTPADVYHHPATAFVASFIGRANLMTGRVMEERSDGTLRLNVNGVAIEAAGGGLAAEEEVVLVIREEEVLIDGDGPNIIEGRVLLSEYHGDSVVLHLATPIGKLRVRAVAAQYGNMPAGAVLSLSLPPHVCIVLPSHRG